MEKPPVLSRPRGVDLIFLDGGGAHRSAATSLRDALLAADPTLEVRIVDTTTEVFAQSPGLRRLFGLGIFLYNATLKAERMYLGDLETLMRFGAWSSRMLRPGAMPAVRAFYRRSAPRVAVSFVPMHNRLLFDALRAERPDAQCMIVPVDFEEIFPGYWFDPEANADCYCGTEQLAQHAEVAGVPRDRIRRIDGMPTHPRFQDASPVDRVATLTALGLDPARPTVLVFFGAQGSRMLVDLAQYLDTAPEAYNIIVVCGHNAAAQRRLAAWTSRGRTKVFGFTREIPQLMRVSDVMVGKPGPVSIYEALSSGVPLVLWDNPAFGVLFDYNVEWIEAQGLGVRIRTASEVAGAVRRVTGDSGFRRRTAQVTSRATPELVRAVLAALDAPAEA